MIDFHCHLDLYPDPSAVLQETVRRECYVLAVTTTPMAWEGTSRVVGDAPRIRLGLGLHPELVASRASEVSRFKALIREARYVGEIGLDGSRAHRQSLPLQREVFRALLEATSAAGGRIMSIHSRGAATAVLEELAEHQGAGTPVLHWFSGSEKELSRAVEMGCWFSVGPAMLRSEKGRRLCSRMPVDRVLTETDGPFARRGREPLVPWDVQEAERGLEQIWGTDSIETHQRLRSNLKAVVAGGGT